MTRILFWNVDKKDLSNLVCDIANDVMADVVILIESGFDVKRMEAVLQQQVSPDFRLAESIKLKRFHCYFRSKSLDLREIHTGNGERLSIRNLRLNQRELLLGLIHGLDPRNNDLNARCAMMQVLANEIRTVANRHNESPLILVGDFNLNPFDPGMNLAPGMNALMSRNCAMQRQRTFQGTAYDIYYNPMWCLLGDDTPGPPGTIYDRSNQGPYGWNMFDQVLIHHKVIDLFRRVQILTNTTKISLKDKHGHPDRDNASDHFPLLIEMEE